MYDPADDTACDTYYDNKEEEDERVRHRRALARNELVAPVVVPPPAPRKPHKNGKRMSNFVFTLNNYTEDEVASLKSIDDVKWLIFGKEVGRDGTPHLQGACVLGKQLAFTTIKKMPGLNRAHIEPMRGKPVDSLVYCSKEDKEPYQFGSLPQPGKRNDLHDVVQLMKEGNSIRDIVNSDNIAAIACVVKYPRGLTFLANLARGERREAPIVIWICGPTGIGKTRSATEFAELVADGDYWMSAGSLRWFDGYDGQRLVILDDFRTKHIEFSMLLRLLDRYSLRVEVKGGYVNWLPQFIVVTAPFGPKEMWNLRRDEDLEQLARRVTHVINEPDYDHLSQALSAIAKDWLEAHPPPAEDIATARGRQATVIDLSVSNSDGVDEADSDEGCEVETGTTTEEMPDVDSWAGLSQEEINSRLSRECANHCLSESDQSMGQ